MYEMTFIPRISEIDINGNIKITSLMDYLQLGVGYEDLFHKNLTWLLVRYTLKIINYPPLDTILKTKSWVVNSESPKYTVRDFIITDEDDKTICKATTSWILFNYHRRKPVNYKDYWPNFKPEEKRALDYSFSPLQLPKQVNRKKSLRVRL